MPAHALLVPVTALFAAFTGLLILYLAYRVTMYRKTRKVGLGDNNDPAFAVEIRAHANAVEYAPISLFLLLVAELNGLPIVALYVFGLMIFGSRVAHAYGFIRSQGKYHPGRFWGIAINWLALLLLSVVNIFWPVLA